ncbi:hypothetical protein JOB18_030814 [Solea senegalensis]|uniref:Uncharacterized protein n=1 Tax=Solea senegalensis TaxID=28829 RepID=A0AAV6SAJ9_SOLSE|nr:hypothetical protein JOB18_030814 [Solea senegalensis]
MFRDYRRKQKLIDSEDKMEQTLAISVKSLTARSNIRIDMQFQAQYPTPVPALHRGVMSVSHTRAWMENYQRAARPGKLKLNQGLQIRRKPSYAHTEYLPT